MHLQRTARPTPLALLAFALIGFGLTACRSMSVATIRAKSGKFQVPAAALTGGPAEPEMAAALEPFRPSLRYLGFAAAMSAAMYDDPVEVKKKNLTRTADLAQFCADPTLYFRPDGSWERYTRVPTIVGGENRIIPGLVYEVWTKREPNQRPVALIAFRGTHVRGDWFANLRWLTFAVPHTWDHYEQAKRIIPPLIRNLKESLGPDAEIIATGHSLGGGLAQAAAYAAGGDIHLVYAFDPSIVTYYHSVDREVRRRSTEDLTILRTYERSEVLSYLRWAVRQLKPIRSYRANVVEVKYRLFPGILVRAHGMRRLACAIDGLTRPPAPPAPGTGGAEP